MTTTCGACNGSGYTGPPRAPCWHCGTLTVCPDDGAPDCKRYPQCPFP